MEWNLSPYASHFKRTITFICRLGIFRIDANIYFPLANQIASIRLHVYMYTACACIQLYVQNFQSDFRNREQAEHQRNIEMR